MSAPHSFVIVRALTPLHIAAVADIKVDEQVYMEMVWNGQALTVGTGVVVLQGALRYVQKPAKLVNKGDQEKTELLVKTRSA